MTVVDPERQAQGFFYRAWRNLTLRGFATRSMATGITGNCIVASE
ncbi:hypothetical protein SALBM311S_04678 [Streptomyces alboniger]